MGRQSKSDANLAIGQLQNGFSANLRTICSWGQTHADFPQNLSRQWWGQRGRLGTGGCVH